ncbi:hypothetical protein CROQUDRAFT_65164 [Cronartium quercuum f. sp. fusiforme G11]|uniref:PWWP domain-containing protein n=1 Tax=Cronartium quercuum f. sp. fusiforme G11 TaxID=708437 RepID=A0A9P6TA77_9BASI|nr:hypothetical protein CROQUDRAFT_65164 [Cronartium quercuum f. sp. fusiforme G11]
MEQEQETDYKVDKKLIIQPSLTIKSDSDSVSTSATCTQQSSLSNSGTSIALLDPSLTQEPNLEKSVDRNLLDPKLLLELTPSSSNELNPTPSKSSSLSDVSDNVLVSLKRRRSSSALESDSTSKIKTTASLSTELPTSSSHLSCLEIGKVIWADIGCTPTQTYWWPGIVEKEENIKDDDNEFSNCVNSEWVVKLFPEKGKKSKALAGCLVRPIKSFNNIKPFVLDINFKPKEFNPILKNKSNLIYKDYPTESSLKTNFSLAYEKYSSSIFDEENDEDLPDVEICLMPLSQQTNRQSVSSRENSNTKESIESADADEDEDEDDGPEADININDETVLAKEKLKGQYWPARVIGYSGLKKLSKKRNNNDQTQFKKEKHYQIKFCDSTIIDLPRSFFLTSDQPDFHTVPIGKVETKYTKFEDLLDEIKSQLPKLDLIIKGESNDDLIKSKHYNFLNDSKTRGLIPKDINYGKFNEKLILKVGQFLVSRYINSKEINEYDEGFKTLTESDKTQYIFDILVPHILWLITLEQYKIELKDELLESGELEMNEEEIIKKAKDLALIELHQTDIVDQVYNLRKQHPNNSTSSPIKKRNFKRSTSNSQRTCINHDDDLEL